MFLMGVVGFAVVWLVVLLAWACCVKAKEADEAMEELNERIRQLDQLASSVRTQGRRAAFARNRTAPLRDLLAEIGEPITEPRGR
jgi:type II secretory pathway component PulJ